MENIFYCEDGEALEKNVQWGGRCLILGNFQDQVDWGSEQPDVVEDVSANWRGLD